MGQTRFLVQNGENNMGGNLPCIQKSIQTCVHHFLQIILTPVDSGPASTVGSVSGHPEATHPSSVTVLWATRETSVKWVKLPFLLQQIKKKTCSNSLYTLIFVWHHFHCNTFQKDLNTSTHVLKYMQSCIQNSGSQNY